MTSTADTARTLAALEVDIARRKAAAEVLRDAIDADLRATYNETGERRTIALDDVVTVRLDKPTQGAVVAHPDEWVAWVSEQHPTESTVTLVVPAAAYRDAVEALEFAGITPATVTGPTVSAAFTKHVLGAVEFVETPDGPLARLTDKDTGDVVDVPGLEPTLGRPRLNVTPAKGAKDEAARAAREAARAFLAGDLGEARLLSLHSAVTHPIDDDVVDAEVVDEPTPAATVFGTPEEQAAAMRAAHPIPDADELATLKVAQLKTILAAHDLRTTGNRRDLLDRLTDARAHQENR